jgi:histidinol-phosphatase
VNADLALALLLADAADEITMRYFRSSQLLVRTKSDRSPVSEADEATERMIRDRLASERPSDAILGEEFGTSGANARRWIIDPIDATGNYVRGVPVFATLIALEDHGVLELGIVSAPALHRRWSATRGAGAYCNGAPIHVSTVDTLSDAFLGYDSIKDFSDSDRFVRLLQSCHRTRGFGDFWAHMLVAEGALDAAIEPRVAHWDMAAIQIIVEEAGGRFTNLEGEARADGGSGLSTNGLIHDAILREFKKKNAEFRMQNSE